MLASQKFLKGLKTLPTFDDVKQKQKLHLEATLAKCLTFSTDSATIRNTSNHLASWLRTRRFSELTFRPSGATNHWKNTVFRDFPTFSRICIFFLLTLSLLLFSLLIFLFSLPLPYSAFHLSILSEV